MVHVNDRTVHDHDVVYSRAYPIIAVYDDKRAVMKQIIN